MAHAPLIHIHIPKTAGTTLSRMIRLRLALWPPSHWIHHATVLGQYRMGYSNRKQLERRCAAINDLPDRSRRRVRFFAAHAGYGLHELMPNFPEVKYVTILRDPIARVISTFHFLRKEGSLPDDMALERFLEHPKHYVPFFIDNGQVRYLAGERGRVIDVPPGQCTAEMLELAKRRLDSMLFFGLTERFDESVLLLARLMRWQRPLYASARVASKGSRQGLSDTALALLRDRNALDLALYEFAQERFAERWSMLGEALSRRLPEFQQLNRIYGRCAAPLIDLLPRMRRLIQGTRAAR